MQHRIKLTLLIGIGVSMLAACSVLQKAVKKPEIAMQGVQVTGLSTKGVEVNFALGVKNPNPLGISLDGMSYKLTLQDKPMLDGKTQQKLKLAANGNSTVNLPLHLEYKSLLEGVNNLFSKDRVRYALSGDLDFGLFRLPYKTEGSFKVPSLPKISVAKVSVGRVTLSGMDVVIGLKLNNRNDFPIRMDGLEYNLKLANTTVAKGRSLGKVALEGGKQQRMDVSLNLPYTQLGGVIKKLKAGGNIPVVLDGKIKLPGAGSVPLSWSGSIHIGG